LLNAILLILAALPKQKNILVKSNKLLFFKKTRGWTQYWLKFSKTANSLKYS